MSDETPKVTEAVRRSMTTRLPGGRFEPAIYIEDARECIDNKYLAVNVAARRARDLNERDLPVGDLAKLAKKPTVQALLELIDGQLTYEAVQPKPALTEADLPFDDETDEDVAALFEEYEGRDDDDGMDAPDDYDDN